MRRLIFIKTIKVNLNLLRSVFRHIKAKIRNNKQAIKKVATELVIFEDGKSKESISLFVESQSPIKHSHVDHFTCNHLIGWLTISRDEFPEIKFLLDGVFIETSYSPLRREDVEKSLGCDQVFGFMFEFIPPINFSGKQQKLAVVECETDIVLMSILFKHEYLAKDNLERPFSEQSYLARRDSDKCSFNCLVNITEQHKNSLVDGQVDNLSRGAIEGWMAKKTGSLNELKVYLDGEEVNIHYLPVERPDVKFHTGYATSSGFNIVFLTPLNLSGKEQSLVIREVDASSSAELGVDLLSIRFSSTFTLPPLMAQGKVSNTVDIVVPIYLGIEETLNCLNSVINAQNKTDYRLILINDFSCDKEMYEVLRTFVRKHKDVTLIENTKNLGFVKTANKGMRLSKSNDVILLNSDTEVSDFWLDKLHNVLKNNPSVATVTPFSNQATIFSFPSMNPARDLPEIAPISLINKYLTRYNVGSIHDVPTAHGFCMLVRRATLNEIGLFDEEKWGKGYAEENDLSIRARLKGWRNVISCDTYVKHVGSVSFKDESTSRISENLALLNQLYPFYLENVADFIRTDPLAYYRLPTLVDLLLQRTASKKYKILHVIHSLGGGTEHAMRTIIEQTKSDEACSIVLRSISRGRVWRIECENQSIIIDMNVTKSTNAAIALLNKINVSHIHYHQLLEFDLNVRDLPDLLSCQYDISLHDYFLLCPKVNLLNELGVNCDGPKVSKCYSCIKSSGAVTNEKFTSEQNISDFFEHNHSFLKAARLNIAPTVGVKAIFDTFADTINVVVKVHPEERVKRTFVSQLKAGIVNIAILGGIGEHKGSHLLKKLVLFADQHQLPLRFIVIGHSTIEIESLDSARMVISGVYDVKTLPELVAKYECDRALFISPWPETFSYTLSEALQCGLYPIALNIGAYKDRLEEYGVGTLLPINSDESDICEALQSTSRNQKQYSFGANYPSIIKDYYNLDMIKS